MQEWLCVFYSFGTGPMSDYNSRALKALRPELKTKVQMKPQLIDLLETPAGGFMTEAEAQSVQSDAYSLMGRLIEILLGKGDKEFDTFCNMLQMSNHPAWAVKLRQEAEKNRTVNQKEGKSVTCIVCTVCV